MIKIAIDVALPLTLGVLELTGVTVSNSSAELQNLCTTAYHDVQQQFAGRNLADEPMVQAVRQLFRQAGIDPTRYRPSSEALLRRVIKAQPLPWINAIVDINNLCSVTSFLPIGAYDLAHITGDIKIRLGQPGEAYVGLAKQYDIAGKIVAVDNTGPFGAPIGDSDRTKITVATRTVLILIFAPNQAPNATTELQKTMDRFANLAQRFTGATVQQQII